MPELHVLNGDIAFELWQKCDFQAQALVWKEIYLEGTLPVTDDLHIFRLARAKYLTGIASVDEIRLYNHLQRMDESILNLPENSTIMLWFDSCIFDQTILMRILYLLDLKKCEKLNVFLYCCNSNCLTINDFQVGMSEKIQLLPPDWLLGTKAWKAFQSQDAESMLDLAGEGNFERLSAMKKALIRCAGELPDKSGLTRTQRNILTLVARGKHSFTEIFKGLSEFEEYPFLGDTSCLRNLETLTGKGLLEVRDGSYFVPRQISVSEN